MQKRKVRPNNAVTLNLSNNTAKETIINTIRASGQFEVDEYEGIVTIRCIETVNRLQKKKLSELLMHKRKGYFYIIPSRSRKYSSLLESIAKSQNITLADPKSDDAVYAGVIL